MAAAFTAHHAQGRVIVASAGTAPAETVDPTVALAMREVGIDVRPIRDGIERNVRALLSELGVRSDPVPS